jgi:aspartate 1-decarboxylase
MEIKVSSTSFFLLLLLGLSGCKAQSKNIFYGEAEIVSITPKEINIETNQPKAPSGVKIASTKTASLKIDVSNDASRYYELGDRICIAGYYALSSLTIQSAKIVSCSSKNDREYLETVGKLLPRRGENRVRISRSGQVNNWEFLSKIFEYKIKETDLIFVERGKLGDPVFVRCNGSLSSVRVKFDTVAAGRQICMSDKPTDGVFGSIGIDIEKENQAALEEFLSAKP